MLTSHLTPRAKGFLRLTLFLAAGCLLLVATSNFTASARNSESGFLRRLFTAPVTTIQQIFKTPGNLAAAPAPMPAAPMVATITVNNNADDTLANLAGNGKCDLREAITAANNNMAVGNCAAGTAGIDNIEFDLGVGTPSINLKDALPNITEPININGNTGGATRVELNGTGSLGAGLSGLAITGTAGGSTIQSLVINNLPANSNGITLNSGGNTVKNCYIGVNAAGTAAAPNGRDGIDINDSQNNIIGGTTAADRNVISGNANSGVTIAGATATGNKIIGNYLGTNAAGNAAIPNGDNGVFISGAPNNFVGGTTAGERNVISGNKNDGVWITGATASGNKVCGNFIGTNAAGTGAVPNERDGVVLGGPNNIIGGTTAGERNIISGNGFQDSFNRGVWIVDANASGNKVIGNYIGTDVTGTAALPNNDYGIFIQDASNNFIGGTAAGEGNIIAYNFKLGARVIENTAAGGVAKGNKILGNSFFDNGSFGIGLSVNSVVANDALDPDAGPNNVQNFPVLNCAVSGNGTTTIRGSLNSLATTSFRIEFFSSDACDPLGSGEGKTFLGFQNVATNASGDATINATFATTVTPGKVITATATRLDATSNPIETSPFSACQTVTAAPTLSIDDVTLTEGDAGTKNFVFTVTLSNAQGSCAPVTVNYATADNSATIANADYASTSGTLTFNTPHASNTLTQTITVQVNGDLTPEANETFFVNLSTPTGAGIVDGQGQGTITNDDVAKTLSINDVAVTEGDAGTVNAVFTVSLNVPATAPISVQYQTANNSATAPGDFTALALNTLNFGVGDQTKQITVVVNGDTTVEGNETFFVNLSNPSGATISDSQGQGTINDDDTATLSINDVAVTEGNAGTVNAVFTVSLSKPSSSTVTVQYQTANNSATAPSDFTALSLATLTFNPGDQTKQVTVVVNGDTTVEGNETFFVNLSNPSGATISDNQGQGTITNDDTATVAINDVAVTEGNAGTVLANFAVTLSKASAEQVTVSYATANNTATTADSDYAAASGTVTFAPGETSKPVAVTVNGDTKVEANETFNVNLSNIVGNDANVPDPTFADNAGQGTITNDDTATVAINDVVVTEGNAGTVSASFAVTLSKPSAEQVTVSYATANGSATTGDNDYAAASGTVTFAAGETSKPVAVTVNGDTKVEGNETFLVNLSNIVGNDANVPDPTFGDNQGQGTITNDDTATVAINDVAVTEGNAGTVLANFAVTLSKASAEQVTVSYATANNTATTADSDYAAASGTVTFAPGETSKPVAVTVNGDTKVEANETFNVNLSNIVGNDANVPDPTFADNAGQGTITNDDFATIAINDVMVTEGNAGTVNATFSVSLTGLVDQPVVVNFATANNSAAAPGDFATNSGSVTFAANTNAPKSITVVVVSDLVQEPDETFFVNLTPNSLPYAAVTIADNQGIGTIKNDDSQTPPSMTASMTDPFVCNGVGGLVEVTAKLTNPNSASYASSFSVTLPSQLTAVPNSCTATTGTCTVTPPNQINWSGTLAANQTVTITYQTTIVSGTPNGQLIVINSSGTVGGLSTSASAQGTVSCPPNNFNSLPDQVQASGQKPGSVLVYPYYTSRAGTRADTRLTLSNIGNQQTIVHLFLIAGNNCQASNLYVCLTPFASLSFKASEYDPEVTGWLFAVAVDRQGYPVQNNSLIGNAFVNEGTFVDNYGAVSFEANSPDVATRSGETARLLFNDVGYDAVPDQYAVELQSPVDVTGQRLVTVGLFGDLTSGVMSGAAQVGIGLIINGNETPSGSFSSFLVGNCQAIATVNTGNPRVPNTMARLIPIGNVGTMRIATGPSAGLLMTPFGNAWSGIRGLHFTHKTFSTITIPTFPPSC